MMQWQSVPQGLTGLCLIGLVSLLVSCSSPGGDGCGGTGDTVSCLDITGITPQDSTGTGSSNVDAFQDICAIMADGTVDVEIFTDHNANLILTNNVFPGAANGFDIRVVGFTVSYTLNDCPDTAACPPLSSFSAGENFIIPAGGTSTQTFPFVPLRTKAEYDESGGSMQPAPSYTATYEIIAQTIPFNDTINATGSAEFTIGNFNLCTN